MMMKDKTNYCDDENEQMMAVPCHPAPYMVTDHPQPSMTVYPVTHIPQQFAPIPQLFPSNSQSTLTPTVEPFYPSLHVYMHPATAPSNTMQTISNTSFTPSTTSLGPHCTPVSTASLVPDQERRILSLEKQLKEAVKELTFFGDRNWRMEAYIDCLVHTLRKMDVTTVIDLNQKMLPLSLFHVKAKAGFHLGSFNQLPRRTVWSYSKEGTRPPNIDLSGTHVVKNEPISKTGLLRSLEEQNLIPEEGDDIGLSAEQLFKYESMVIELQRETCILKERLQIAFEKENILMERLRTSQQANNLLEEDINNKSVELNRAQHHIARLEHPNFRRFPRHPHFPGRFRPRIRYPFQRPPFPYPPHSANTRFPPPPPMLADPPLPPQIENENPSQLVPFEGAPMEEAQPIITLPPDQPIYFIAPPFPPPCLPPCLPQFPPPVIDEVVSNVPSTTDIQMTPNVTTNTSVAFIPIPPST